MTVPAPPTLTPAPSPAPTRADPANFNVRADAYHSWLVPHVNTELPSLITWMSARSNEIADAVDDAESAATAAVGAANFKGDYAAGTTYQIGQSVSDGGKVWIAKTVNLGITPVEGSNWMELKSSSPPFDDPIVLAQIHAITLSF